MFIKCEVFDKGSDKQAEFFINIVISEKELDLARRRKQLNTLFGSRFAEAGLELVRIMQITRAQQKQEAAGDPR